MKKGGNDSWLIWALIAILGVGGVAALFGGNRKSQQQQQSEGRKPPGCGCNKNF